MSLETGAGEYRPATTLAKYTTVLLYVVLGINVAMIVLSIAFFFVPDPRALGNDGSAYRLVSGASGLVWMIGTMVRLGLVVVFLMWFFRCYKNLPALDGRSPRFSPAWAVICWFVPFINFIKPYQAMRDLWNESDPDNLPDDELFRVEAPTSPVVIRWWGTFVFAWIVSWVIGTARMGNTKDLLTIIAALTLVNSVVWAIATVFVFPVVRGVTTRQEARFLKVGRQIDSFGPPPPPTFDSTTAASQNQEVTTGAAISPSFTSD